MERRSKQLYNSTSNRLAAYDQKPYVQSSDIHDATIVHHFTSLPSWFTILRVIYLTDLPVYSYLPHLFTHLSVKHNKHTAHR